MLGTIMVVHVIILVDMGSYHNFIDVSLLTKLHLKLNPSTQLSIRVANGQCLQIKELCEPVNLKVQCNHFPTSFYLLELFGCEVVLGV